MSANPAIAARRRSAGERRLAARAAGPQTKPSSTPGGRVRRRAIDGDARRAAVAHPPASRAGLPPEGLAVTFVVGREGLDSERRCEFVERLLADSGEHTPDLDRLPAGQLVVRDRPPTRSRASRTQTEGPASARSQAATMPESRRLRPPHRSRRRSHPSPLQPPNQGSRQGPRAQGSSPSSALKT